MAAGGSYQLVWLAKGLRAGSGVRFVCRFSQGWHPGSLLNYRDPPLYVYILRVEGGSRGTQSVGVVG